MSGSQITELDENAFKGSENLRSKINPNVFKHLHELEALDLTRNLITKIPRDFFIGNNKLYFIYLKGNKITEIETNTFSHLRNLRLFDLSNNSIELFGNSTISSYNRSEDIDLLLQYNKLSEKSFSKESFVFSHKNTSLRLFLFNNSFTSFPEHIFGQFLEFNNKIIRNRFVWK